MTAPLFSTGLFPTGLVSKDHEPVEPVTPEAWVALSLLPGVGPRTVKALREQALAWPEAWLSALSPKARVPLQAYLCDPLESPLGLRVSAYLRWCDGEARSIVTPSCAAWPSVLDELPDPPIVLWAHGAYSALTLPGFAMVGTRKPTSEGAFNARRFSQALAQQGLAVISGLALGVDGLCHQAALEAGAPTVAVLGCGIDVVYPRQHQRLRERIVAEGGLLLSEHPPGVQARPQFFPRRNRLITGLALGVLVVEATLKSGSLVSARLALEQNREVFALPGSLSNPQARGCLHLIQQQGAKLVIDVDDILGELLLPVSEQVLARPAAPDQADVPVAGLAAFLGAEPVAIDVLVERAGKSIAECASELMMLELEGVVQQVAGGWVRCR
ncbi:DNA-processing protein DprA [Larsenimonas salina]|uniref:DNA-processing protein DprA n=1 Tax=Larsenimonas salina TaxID=1295565 RepID=UPI00207313F5|nr:DNA-processing protein DprA [Larsenimonas salina]MCM5704348.1 DNA-processing protein DprA [Larsenimonas salina]